jgi:hypothetical protein
MNDINFRVDSKNALPPNTINIFFIVVTEGCCAMLMGTVSCQTSHVIYSDVTYEVVALDRLARLCKIDPSFFFFLSFFLHLSLFTLWWLH